MNKYSIFGLMALTAVAFTSCQDDDSPKIQKPTEFVLNTPPFANQLYELTPTGTIEFTCSQPNYGLSLAPTYGIEISLLSDFGETTRDDEEEPTPIVYTILPTNPHSAVITINESDVAAGLCALRGIKEDSEYTDPGPMTVYVRATANINSQEVTKINSNIIKLPQVQGYSAFTSPDLDVVYVPGNANDWNHETCQQLLADPNPDHEGIYRGFIYINGEFKFTPGPDWSAEWGGEKDENDEVIPGKVVTSGGGNIPTPSEGDGLYYVVLDTKALSYTTTFIGGVYVVGAFNDWNTEEAPAMTHSEDYQTWTFAGDLQGGEFKFTFNRGWTINLGGEFSNLVIDGDNLTAPAGGSVLTLDLHKLPYTATYE